MKQSNGKQSSGKAPVLSPKGQKLVAMYEDIAEKGLTRNDGQHVAHAYARFELGKFRRIVQPFLARHRVTSVLDYGCGGSDWAAPGFDPESGASAMGYFGLNAVARYEPARGIDERRPVDAVVCIDVLEHILIPDLPATLEDIFAQARRAVVLNVACYPSSALLPNGENAHVTVRAPLWWRGVVDMVALRHPDVTVLLICSPRYDEAVVMTPWSARDLERAEAFVHPPLTARRVRFGRPD